MSGKVVPRRIDCGRIMSAAMSHFTTTSAQPPASMGKIVSYAASEMST